MEKRILKSVYFKKLKGLHDIKIEFSETLTAIMGVNGIGKTTVIHALACIYQPDGNSVYNTFNRNDFIKSVCDNSIYTQNRKPRKNVYI